MTASESPSASGAFGQLYISLAGAVAGHARWNPEGVALVCGSQRVSWRELDERINRVANGLLARGLRRGDRVAALMGNCIEMVEAIAGTVRAGGVTVPLSPLVSGSALAGIINDSDARFVLAAAPLHEAIAPIRDHLQNIAGDGFILSGADAEGWEPYERWGETPLALLVLRPGSAITAEALTAWCNERVGGHQRISAVELRDQIPRVPPLGKVPKRDLRAPYWEDSARTCSTTQRMASTTESA